MFVGFSGEGGGVCDDSAGGEGVESVMVEVVVRDVLREKVAEALREIRINQRERETEVL